MRRLALLLSIIPAAGQPSPPSRTSVYTYDANGQRTLAGQQISGAGGSEQLVRNMNGRIAPLEQVEEKVISENGVERIVEKTVRPFDAAGGAQPGQKIRITESKRPDGSKIVDTQIYQGNINGGFSLTERSRATERKEGARLVVDTLIDRATINGALETVEKRAATTTIAGAKTTEDTLVYRKDTSGTFYAAARSVKEVEKRDGHVTENTANYAAGAQRQMELVGQTVTETRQEANGSETRKTSVYGMNAPGRPAAGQPVLREQQITERNKTATGTVETFSIRRPAVDNPNSLGPAQKISEKICTGPCQQNP
ncbi:MAG TPA: hypothetical protein VFQ91_11230 [Bryobacteraceae bacterium]|nr:hypothetical protein [Bryobacteraceae bacterium]